MLLARWPDSPHSNSRAQNTPGMLELHKAVYVVIARFPAHRVSASGCKHLDCVGLLVSKFALLMAKLRLVAHKPRVTTARCS